MHFILTKHVGVCVIRAVNSHSSPYNIYEFISIKEKALFLLDFHIKRILTFVC